MVSRIPFLQSEWLRRLLRMTMTSIELPDPSGLAFKPLWMLQDKFFVHSIAQPVSGCNREFAASLRAHPGSP
jgi:hypothetical protein